MSESILRHGGWRTALYTSPDLVRITERICVAGRPISSRRFASLVDRIRGVESEMLLRQRIDRPLTYFEFITVCAFLHFLEERIDIAIVEVGLGGALDATNVVRPHACVITGISYDHQNLLGNTLAEIAGEKAGIIKECVPIVSGCRSADARRVIRRKARLLNAPLSEIDKDCVLRIVDDRHGFCTVDLETRSHSYRRLRLSLAGEHQARNAALAVLAVESLEAFPVTLRDIRLGLARTRWPGRLDEYRAGRRTLLEGAHNPEGASLLREFLLKRNESEVHLVFGAVRDKDIRKMSGSLFPLAQSIHLTPLRNSRSASADDIAAMHPRFRGRIELHANSRAALRAAWNRCSRKGLVVVTGSLYLVGELLPIVQATAKKQTGSQDLGAAQA